MTINFDTMRAFNIKQILLLFFILKLLSIDASVAGGDNFESSVAQDEDQSTVGHQGGSLPFSPQYGKMGRRVKRNLNVYSNLELKGKVMKNTAPYPVGMNLILTCQNVGRKPFWYHNMKQLSVGVPELGIANFFKADHSIDSLTSDHHGVTLSCMEDSTTRVNNVTINVLALPTLKMSYKKEESYVPLSEATALEPKDSILELRCAADEPIKPDLKICISVGKEERCDRSGNINFVQDLKQYTELSVSCQVQFSRTDFLDNLREFVVAEFEKQLRNTAVLFKLQKIEKNTGSRQFFVTADTENIKRFNLIPEVPKIPTTTTVKPKQSMVPVSQSETDITSSSYGHIKFNYLLISLVTISFVVVIALGITVFILLHQIRRPKKYTPVDHENDACQADVPTA